MENWFKREKEYLYLPFFIIWNLWLTKNDLTFEDKSLDMRLLYHGIVDQLCTYLVIIKRESKCKCIGMALVLAYPSGFFNGAATNMNGGDGIHLLIS